MSTSIITKMEADAAAINALHEEIVAQVRTTLDKALEIGRHLDHVKSRLAHGEWLPWIKSNLKFSESTARRYLAIHENRGQLKSVNVTDLTEAYETIKGSPKPIRSKRLIGITAAARLMDVSEEAVKVAQFFIKEAPHLAEEIKMGKLTFVEALYIYIGVEALPTMKRMWAITPGPDQIEFLQWLKSDAWTRASAGGEA